MHQDSLKARIPADVGSQMLNVDVLFAKDLRVCFCPMRQSNRFGFRNVHLFCEHTRETIDEERLSRCLPMQSRDDLGLKHLSDFCSILSKQLLHLFEGEVRQVEFVLDIKR